MPQESLLALQGDTQTNTQANKNCKIFLELTSLFDYSSNFFIGAASNRQFFLCFSLLFAPELPPLLYKMIKTNNNRHLVDSDTSQRVLPLPFSLRPLPPLSFPSPPQTSPPWAKLHPIKSTWLQVLVYDEAAKS